MQGEPAVRGRYLIVTDAAQIQPAELLLGETYAVMTLESAMNGRAKEIAGSPLVIWPDRHTVSKARTFGREMAEWGEVKLLDAGKAFLPSPVEAIETAWDASFFVDYVYGRTDNCPNIVELLHADDESATVAPSPGLPPDSGSPLESDLPSPDEGAPFEKIPVEAYSEAQGPLTPDQAYTPYTEPGNLSEWPAMPSDWWSEGNVPEMQPEVMPPCFRDYILRESETMGVDPGIFALYVIGFCAGALSDSHVLQVKPDNPRWVQPARLWLMIVGNSSTKKSPALNELRGAAWKLELDMRKRSMSDEERFTEETRIYEKQMEGYISAKAKGESRDKPPKPMPPNRERLLVGNATVESLADILLFNPRGVLNVMDELSGILKGLGQYKQGGNDKEAYLMGFDGGPYPIDRKGRAELIPNFGWSLIGGTQKQKIRDVSAALRLESDGFMARFVPYVARVATEDLDRPADHEGYQHFSDVMHRLWDMQSNGPIKFSDEAQKVRREFSSWAWNQAKGEWLGESLRSAVSKYDTQFARFCLTYHAIECANNHNAYLAPEISAETAGIVARLFKQCLYHHAENVYLHILDASSDIMQHVRKIAGKILAKGWTEIKPTTLAQGWTGWRKLNQWQRRAILGVLVEGGWIRTNDRRGYVEGVTITYECNPRLREIFPHHTEMEIAYLEDMAERRERMAGKD